jgi:hypothetical protein
MKKGAEDAFRSARKRTKAFKKRDCKSVFSLVPREIRDGKKRKFCGRFCVSFKARGKLYFMRVKKSVFR